MFISMKDNPGARAAEMTNTYGSYVNTELIAANVNNTNLTEATRAFYQQQQVMIQQRDEYIEVSIQEGVLGGNSVYPITDRQYFPAAPPLMQRYILAHPRTTERAKVIGNMYTGKDLTGNQAIVGVGNIAHDRVMDQHFRVDERHMVIIHPTKVDQIIPPLTQTEQLYVQTTWATLDGMSDLDDDEFGNEFKDIVFY